jgi:Domain of unknown function (DUF4177)
MGTTPHGIRAGEVDIVDRMKPNQLTVEAPHPKAFPIVEHALTLPVILAAFVFLIPCGGSFWTSAQQPVPAVAGARYKVIDISQTPLGNGMGAAQTLEALLNDLAGQGWRVVAISGSLIILSAG